MARSRRARALTVAAIVVGVLALSLALVLTQQRRHAGATPARFGGSTTVRPLPSVMPSPELDRSITVAIVRDEASAGYYGRAATLDSAISHWQRVLATTGVRVSVARSSALPAGASGADVLLLPTSPCLTIASRALLDDAVRRGRGIVLAGAVGTHDAGCREIGYGLLASLTGASRIEPLEERSVVYVTLLPGTPLSPGIPPGARIELGPAAQLAVRHPARAAFYSDYTLVPAPAADTPLLDGALLAVERERARVAYLGFEPGDVEDSPWNRTVLALVVRNAVAWAARRPLGEIEPWPRGHRSAAVLAQDVEAEFANARYALDTLSAIGVRSTFFLTSDIARRHARLSRAMADAGEIGTHSDDHGLLGGTTSARQRGRLVASRRDLRQLVRQPVQGLRPPEEQFDRVTIQAWLHAGGRYIFGANDSRSAAPELLPIGLDTLVLLGRAVHDDFGVVGIGGVRDVEEVGDVFLAELGKTHALGGLFMMSYHSQLLSRPDLVPALARVARALVADSAEIWTTTAGEVADWWRARAGVEVESRLTGARRLTITVRNAGSDTVEGGVARVHVGGGRLALRAGALVLQSEPGVVRLALPALPPRSTRTIEVTLGG